MSTTMWLYDHLGGYVFIFAPSELPITCTLNAPGCWHDSSIAKNGGLYSALKSVYEATSGTRVVNSGFSLNQCPFFIKSGKRKVGKTFPARTQQR